MSMIPNLTCASWGIQTLGTGWIKSHEALLFHHYQRQQFNVPSDTHIMPSLTLTGSEFHEGEDTMHRLLKVPQMGNPTNEGFPAWYAQRLLNSPLVAVGTVDDEGRPWTTIWGGQRGFARRIAEDVVGMNSEVDRLSDPVFQALWDGQDTVGGEVAQGRDRLMSGLSIDLETRDRVKLAGKMVAGTVVDGKMQMAMHVTESLGNCPKYLNKKDITPHSLDNARLASQGLPLSEGALEVLRQADMFFMSSTAGTTMDTNHRGGPPGFVRVLKNNEDEVVIVYPECESFTPILTSTLRNVWKRTCALTRPIVDSGNRLYQSLGNLKVNPLIGIVVPDYHTGDVLYLTGSAAILIGEQASSVIARTNLAVEITVTDARFVKAGLPFRGSVIDYSPYNPPVRQLLTEKTSHISSDASALTATLVNREHLTPTIARFTLELSSQQQKWFSGQYVTIDFYDELSGGYAHMNDADPQSLNDDYVRTFTVSSPAAGGSNRLEITARKHGPATGLLWRHPLRVPLELPVMGFGGEEAFRMARHDKKNVFVAGGVGITPLLAQAGALVHEGNSEDLEVLWALRGEDLALAVDSFDRIPGLARITTLFVTGDTATQANQDGGEDLVEKVKRLGAKVEVRRIGEQDMGRVKGQSNKFYLCASPTLLTKLNGWLEGEDMVWEDFNY